IDPIIFKTIPLVSITPSLMIFTFFFTNKFHRFYPFQRSFFITFFIFFTYFFIFISAVYFIFYFNRPFVLCIYHISKKVAETFLFILSIINSSIIFFYFFKIAFIS